MNTNATELKRTANPTKDLKKTRAVTKLNQHDFWSRVGVTQSGGSRYESGRSIPAPIAMLVEITYGTNPAKVLKKLGVEVKTEGKAK